MFASGRLLSQVRPAGTLVATVLSGLASELEVTALFVANTTGVAATFRLFIAADGVTFDQSTALYYDVSVAANSTFTLRNASDGTGIVVGAGHALAVRSGTASALTYTLFGVSAAKGR